MARLTQQTEAITGRYVLSAVLQVQRADTHLQQNTIPASIGKSVARAVIQNLKPTTR